MQPVLRGAPVAIDLSRLQPRTITSFYSNLVTRPTGRAVRLGVERQLAEVVEPGAPCLSILDFSQVRILDFSCADEIVAKLLLRYGLADRPVEAFFVARGLQEHHLEAVEAVLERHGLLLAVESAAIGRPLLGPCDPFERSCYELLVTNDRMSLPGLSTIVGAPEPRVVSSLRRFLESRVAVLGPDGSYRSVHRLSHG